MGQTFQANAGTGGQAATGIAAGATLSALLGSTIEYQNKASVLTIYQNGNAAGLLNTFFMNDGQTTVTIIPPGSGVSPASTAGKIKTNEDFVIQYAIPAGEHLIHQVTNPTAADVPFNAMYVIT